MQNKCVSKEQIFDFFYISDIVNHSKPLPSWVTEMMEPYHLEFTKKKVEEGYILHDISLFGRKVNDTDVLVIGRYTNVSVYTKDEFESEFLILSEKENICQ